MKVVSARFGELQVREEDIISFPEGLVGFQSRKKFFIYNREKNFPFFWLHSMDDPNLAFVITDPKIFFPDYKVAARRKELETIDVRDTGNLIVCVIVSISREPFRMSANLQGPLVVNTNNRRGKQVVLVDSNYGTRHEIPIRHKSFETPADMLIPRRKDIVGAGESALVLT